jgi:hypothetical protein
MRALGVSLVAGTACCALVTPAAAQAFSPHRVVTPHAVVELITDWDNALPAKAVTPPSGEDPRSAS